jgi:hypothetical protein
MKMSMNTFALSNEASDDYSQDSDIENDDLTVAFDLFERGEQIRRTQMFEKEQIEAKERRKQKELARLERIKAGGGNQLIYALREILRTSFLGNGTSRTSYYDLGFENTTNGLRESNQLLLRLKEDGCIQDFSQLADDSFKIDGVQEEKIQTLKLALMEKSTLHINTIKNTPTERMLSEIVFCPDSNSLGYRESTITLRKGTKGLALVQFLSSNRSVGFNIEEIKDYCNQSIEKGAHWFKSKKDVTDTIREIRAKLGVKKSERFPIQSREIRGEKQWILAEK